MTEAAQPITEVMAECCPETGSEGAMSAGSPDDPSTARSPIMGSMTMTPAGRLNREDNLEQPRFGELGRLEYDPVEDALLCHVCGRWYKNLAQHARRAHQLEADDYRELAGLNRQTRLVTPTIRERLRASAIPLIARLRAEGKLRRWDEDPEKWRQAKESAAEVLRKGLRAEGSRHRRESWNDERLQEKAEKRRARNLAGLDRATPGAISEGLRSYYAEHPEAVDRDRLRRMARMPKATEKSARDAVCLRCKSTFRAMSHRDKYCPSCRPKVAREYATEYARERRRAAKEGTVVVKRQIKMTPREAVCPRCGEEFLAASHRDRYCVQCREVVWKEYRTAWKRDHRKVPRGQQPG